MDFNDGVVDSSTGAVDTPLANAGEQSATTGAGEQSQSVTAMGQVAEPTAKETPETDAHPYDGDPSSANWAKARSSYEKLNGGFTEVAKALLGEEALAEIAKLPITERVERLTAHYQQTREELDLLKSDEFVGIKVDRPSAQWEPKEQLAALPEPYRVKLGNEVIAQTLPQITDTLLESMDRNDPRFQAVYSSTVKFAEKAFARPISEVDAIMDVFAGMPMADVQNFLVSAQQALAGGGGNGTQFGTTGTYANQNGGYQSPSGVAQNNTLLQAAINAGLDLEDPAQAQFVNSISQALTANQMAAQRESSLMRQQMEAMRRQIDELSGKTQQAEVQGVQKQVETQVTTIHTTALENVTKGIQTLPQTEKDSLTRQIRALARDILDADQSVKDAPELIKGFIADGLEAKANYQRALLSSRVQKAYATAASEILKGKVSQTAALRDADQRKQARKEVGQSNLNTPQAPAAGLLQQKVGASPDDAANYAAELYRQSRAS